MNEKLKKKCTNEKNEFFDKNLKNEYFDKKLVDKIFNEKLNDRNFNAKIKWICFKKGGENSKTIFKMWEKNLYKNQKLVEKWNGIEKLMPKILEKKLRRNSKISGQIF